MIALGVGQRADILVKAMNQSVGILAFYMRSNIVACSQNDGIQTEARAIIVYPGGQALRNIEGLPNVGPAAVTAPQACANDPLDVTEPAFPIPVTAPSTTVTLNIQPKSNGTNILFYLGNDTFRANYGFPSLGARVWQNATSILDLPHTNVLRMGSNTTIRAIIYNYDDAPHPIRKSSLLPTQESAPFFLD